jgi:DNA-binding FadR family transcriptional regulator
LASRRLTGSKEANAQRALRAHEAILKKVEAKDVEGARIEMRKHMMITEHDMRATIGD